LYRLTIKELDKGSGEIKATVAETVVDQNRDRENQYFGRQVFSTDWFTDYRVKDYPFHVYAFRLQDQNDLGKLTVREIPYDFENVPDTHYLRLCEKNCKDDRQRLIDKHYKDKNK
jgi:hypothetical protein